MKAIEYLEELRKKRRKSYRDLANATGLSDSFWWLLKDGKKTPTLENAWKFANAIELNEEERKIVMNIVFKERLLGFLEKEGATKNNPTPSIRSLIKSLRKWHPEKGQPIGYIMYTLSEIYGPEVALEIKQLGGGSFKDQLQCLTGEERVSDLGEGFYADSGGCSKGFGGLGI